MRLLLIHAEEFSFKARERALEAADELTPDLQAGEARNALVAFVTVEKDDIDDIQYLSKVADDILDVARRVKAESIVLYPYAHLSPNLAPASRARGIFNALYEVLKSKSSMPVIKAPFGYYKAFSIRCIGHPLSELSRSYTPEKAEAPQAVRPITGDFYVIITPNGLVHKAEEYGFKKGEEDLKVLVEKEVFKRELPGGREPKYLDYCRKFGFEWEPMSDIGHMRYGPLATLMLELVEDYAWILARELGIPVFKIKGTNMFRKGEKAIAEHARLFGERMYTLESDGEELIMRYAACFQQFAIVKDWYLTERDLPFGIIEIADSYRYEQPGETVLCFRLRRFYMPDLHIFTKDLNEALEISFKLHELIFREAHKLGRDYVSLYNVTREFYERHRDYLFEIARREGKPILVRVLPEQRYYWVLNVEFHIIDELKRPREIATYQIDVGNAERFGIRYRDASGDVKYPVIIHTAIIGSIERYIYMLLDTAAQMEAKGQTPRLPTWITPIQVRLIPITQAHLEFAERIADQLEGRMIRVDIDDRFEETLGRRIRDAETLWIPYIVVIGDKELKSGRLSVRVRGIGVFEWSLDELMARIEEEIRGYPRRPLTLPRYVSKRPLMA